MRMRHLRAVSIRVLLFVFVFAVSAKVCIAVCGPLAQAILKGSTHDIGNSTVYVHFHERLPDTPRPVLSVYSNYAPVGAPAGEFCPGDFSLQEATGAGLVKLVNDAIEQAFDERPITVNTDTRGISVHFGHDLFDAKGRLRVDGLMDARMKSFVVYGNAEKPLSLELEDLSLKNGPPLDEWPYAAKWKDGLYFRIVGPSHRPVDLIQDLSRVSIRNKKISVGYTEELGAPFDNDIRKVPIEAQRISKASAVASLFSENGITVVFGHNPEGDGIRLRKDGPTLDFKVLKQNADATKTVLIVVTCESARAGLPVGILRKFCAITALNRYFAASNKEDLLAFLQCFADPQEDMHLVLNPSSLGLEHAVKDATFDVVGEVPEKQAAFHRANIHFTAFQANDDEMPVRRIGKGYILGQVLVYAP